MTTSIKNNHVSFAPSELARLDPLRIPKHIAFIPDGNRRWAKKRSSSAQQGHREGADTLMDIVKAGLALGVKELSFYAFSTENWNRPAEEVDALMALYTNYLITQRDEMVSLGIKLETIGNTDALPLFLIQAIAESRKATKDCKNIRMILALNYGARDELCRAFKKMSHAIENGEMSSDDITEATVSQYLDTREFYDPELLIRTSGELRISNFLLWQISYTEIHISPVLWPDFTPHHLLEAVIDYQGRERRLGSENEKRA